MLREATGVSLKEAKEAVERLTEKVAYLDAERAAERETITPAHEEMLELLVQGKKREALKVFKDQAVLDFKASREETARGAGVVPEGASGSWCSSCWCSSCTCLWRCSSDLNGSACNRAGSGGGRPRNPALAVDGARVLDWPAPPTTPV